MRVQLLYAKLLKETETEETIVFFVTFLSMVAFQLGGGGSLAPLATPMGRPDRCRSTQAVSISDPILLALVYLLQ